MTEVEESSIVLPSGFDTLSFEEKCQLATVIAQPMAPEKLTKRLLKLARKAKRVKKTDICLKTILKSIEKKNESGIVLLAGDTTPIDLISHVPIVCEENNIPYCFVPSKFDLGACVFTSTAVSFLFIMRDDTYGELYDKCYAAVDALPLPVK